MGYEDFTTYTEVDPNAHISKTANHIDHDCYDNEDAYVYADKGVDHFGNFAHLIEITSDFLQLEIRSGTWELSNDIDDLRGLLLANKTCIFVAFDKLANGEQSIRLWEHYNGSPYSDKWVSPIAGTKYYCTITKSGTALTCVIRTGSHTGTIQDTLSLTLHGDWKFRYIFGCSTYNEAVNIHANSDVDNLDLQEGLSKSLAATMSLHPVVVLTLITPKGVEKLIYIPDLGVFGIELD